MKLRFLFLAMLSYLGSYAQEKSSWVSVEKLGLYDKSAWVDTNPIEGFKQVSVFSDDFGSEVWVSKETPCVTMSKVTTPVVEGSAAIHVTWDKVTGGCSWIGMGFGWEDWQPKDMSGLPANVGLRMYVRAVKGSFSNFPVAFAFEDYSGVQSYCGFNIKQADGRFTDKGWTRVEIPLSDFPFIQNGADLSKIKQFMIQLEGAGDVYIDDIRLIQRQP